MYSSLMIRKSPTFRTLVLMVLCIRHVLILLLLILWSYLNLVMTASKSLDYPVTLSINNTLRWGVALLNPDDVTISSLTFLIFPNNPNNNELIQYKYGLNTVHLLIEVQFITYDINLRNNIWTSIYNIICIILSLTITFIFIN